MIPTSASGTVNVIGIRRWSITTITTRMHNHRHDH